MLAGVLGGTLGTLALLVCCLLFHVARTPRLRQWCWCTYRSLCVRRKSALLGVRTSEVDSSANGDASADDGTPMGGYEQVKLLGRGGSGSAFLMRRAKDGDLCVCKIIAVPLADLPAATHGRARRQSSNEPSILGDVELSDAAVSRDAATESGRVVGGGVSVKGKGAVEVGEEGSVSLPTEVSILKSLEHPHIIRYLHSSLEDGPTPMLRIWMEYAPGGSLDRAIHKHARVGMGFTTLRICGWTGQLTDAIDHMHSRRVLHRDLKTANIFLTHAGELKLGDFGVARSFSTHTHFAQTQVGTPYYMAPEVIDGKAYGDAADVWSLGIILYELLTLRRPFDASNLGALVIAIQSARFAHGKALASCGHHPLLCEMASPSGLLHLDPSKRLTIRSVRMRLLDLLYDDDTLNGGAHGGAYGADHDALLELLWPASPSERRTDRSTDRSTDPSTERATDRSTSLGVPSGLLGATTWTQEQMLAALQQVPCIPAASIKWEAKLGAGGFGDVWLATWTDAPDSLCAAEGGGGVRVAIKTLRAMGPHESQVREICKECALLCSARHAHVVGLYGLTVGAEATIGLLMEHMGGGSLYDLLRSMEGRMEVRTEEGRMEEQQQAVPASGTGASPSADAALLEIPRLISLLSGVALGMAYLHARGIIHRDLKSDNLLLDSEHTSLKICDFGLSREAFVTAKMTRVGTVQWAAPEVLLGIAYSHQADVWSFGVILWEMLTGKVPYAGMRRLECARGVAEGTLRLPMPPVSERCPAELLRLLRCCFDEEKERPGFGEVQQLLEVCSTKA